MLEQADKEREEHRRQMEQSLGQQFMRDDSSLTNSYSSSIDEYPAYCRDPNADISNAETLRHLLRQVGHSGSRAKEQVFVKNHQCVYEFVVGNFLYNEKISFSGRYLFSE